MAWRQEKTRLGKNAETVSKTSGWKLVIFCFPEWFHWNLGKIIAVERFQLLLFCSLLFVFASFLLLLPPPPSFFFVSGERENIPAPFLPLRCYPLLRLPPQKKWKVGRGRKRNKNLIKKISNFPFPDLVKTVFFINFQILMMAFYDQK